MPLPSTTPQDSHAIMVAVLIVAALCVIYWRKALQLVVIVLIAFTVYGLIIGLH
jgi:hypothetical protein